MQRAVGEWNMFLNSSVQLSWCLQTFLFLTSLLWLTTKHWFPELPLQLTQSHWVAKGKESVFVSDVVPAYMSYYPNLFYQKGARNPAGESWGYQENCESYMTGHTQVSLWPCFFVCPLNMNLLCKLIYGAVVFVSLFPLNSCLWIDPFI